MKKFVNIRIPVLFACLLIAGIFIGNLIAYYGGNIFWALTILPVTALLFIILLVLRKYKILIISMLFIVAFSTGLLNTYFRLYNYSLCEIDETQTYTVTATVSSKNSNSYGDYLILDNVKVNDKKIDGKIYAKLSDTYGEFCDEAYTVKFSSKLTKLETYPYGKLNYRAEDNIQYSCSIYGGLQSDYHFSLFAAIRTAIRNTLFDNADKDIAAICYGMLIGDTDLMDDGTLSIFRYGGIAHIFAVSGLHIGIIFLIVGFILNLFKPNKYVSAIIRIAFIIFYSGVCGFTLSSIRAVIMCSLSVIAQLIYRKGDTLNFLAIAATLILIVTPLSLYSVGFQLSVCAVGGLAIISSKITKQLNKFKIPQAISSSTGAAFGAQLGTFPVMLSNFGYVSVVGLLLNIVFVPVLSALFILLFGGTVISVIIPPIAKFLVPFSVMPLSALISFLINYGFENTLITGFGSGAFVVIYFIGLAILSDKIKLKILHRTFAVAAVALIAVIYCVIMTYTPVNSFNIAVSANYYSGNVIIKSSSGTVLVTTDGQGIPSFLNENYSSFLDGVIILNGDDSISGYDTSLKCGNVYVYSKAFPAQPYRNVEIHYEDSFNLCGIDFEFVDGYSLTADCDGVKVAVCSNKFIPIQQCDLLVSTYENNYCRASCTVYFSLHDHKYNIYEFGELHFNADDGKLFRNGIVPKRKCLY